MMRNILLSILILLFAMNGYAQQSKVISGSIRDKQTGEPVAFANIGIEGTYYGAASTNEGLFEFKIPADLNSGTLFASAVGYQGYRIELKEIHDAEKMNLEIDPTAYDIGVVDVSANSLVLYKVMKDAIDAIGKNYPQQPFSFTAYYKNELSENNQPPRVDESVVVITDAAGYKRENPKKEQANRNYRVTESRRNFEVKTLVDGMNMMDNLLMCDIVRTRRNILDKPFLKGYDLSADALTTYEGEPAWVINYTLNNPTFDRTGFYNLSSYQGKIYISKKDNAILKNELWIRAKNPSPHGWAIASAENGKNTPTSAEYEIVTIYKKNKGGYSPAFIKSVSRIAKTDPTSGGEKTVASESYLLPTATNTSNPVLLKNRDYYSEKPYNKSFWDTFDIAIE